MNVRNCCLALLTGVITVAAPAEMSIAQNAGNEVPPPATASLSAAKATAVVERATGRVTSVRLGEAGEEMCLPHPAGGERPFAFVEVVDLRDGRIYSPTKVRSAIAGWRLDGASGARRLRFTQQYEGAPFRIAHTMCETAVGIRWEASLRLLPGRRKNRSVQVCWMVPVPWGWRFWGPNDTVAHRTDAVTPYRFVYGHTGWAPTGTIIPLVGVWGKRGGAAVFSPPDVRKCQIMFDIPGQRLFDPPKGVFRHVEDLQMLRVAHHAVGLRPGRELSLAICVAGVLPDWRAAMGHYAKSYPELFEPIPAARKYEGRYAFADASHFRPASLERLKARRVTCVEVHGHFPEYGVYITADALKDPSLTWRCKPHSGRELSLARNREMVAQMNKAGVPAFMYFYNVHANAETIRKRFAADLMLGEAGKPNIQYQGEPALRAQPGSPFGRHLIEQMDLMLKAYPEAPGFFVDNFSIQWVDFAHDDGVMMIRHRPAYDLNRNHQVIGPICFEKAHKAGKVIMVNKLATIESARGVDMVLLEGMTLDGLKMNALPCAYRAVFPTRFNLPRGQPAERGMQYLLIWGGTPGPTVPAYRPLTDALIGKRWVFDPDPLTLPAGFEGQIFRIDKHAPRAGDVVVSLVHLGRSWRDEKFTEGLSVTVRLPEAGELRKATWLAVERSDRGPQPCRMERSNGELKIWLPPVGAAGILRLSRRR